MKTLSLLAILLCGSLLVGCSRYKALTVDGPVRKEKKAYRMPSQKGKLNKKKADKGKRDEAEQDRENKNEDKHDEPPQDPGNEASEQTGLWGYLQRGATHMQNGFNYVWNGTAWVLDNAKQKVKSVYNHVTGANEDPNTN